MKKLTLLSISLSTFSLSAQQNQSTNMSEEPKALKKQTVLINHDHKRIDDYFWMNERDSKEVLDQLNAENAYSKSYFSSLENLQKTLLDEFNNRIDPNEVSSPFILNDRTYQVRHFEELDYSKIILIENGTESVFFDENERSKNKSFYELADWSPSPNNELLAISEDFVGRRKYAITFRNNGTKKFLKDKISDTDGSIVWANDNQTIFYVKKDPQTLREFQVFRHVLGTDEKKDVLVYQEDDEKYSVYISKTITDQYILIHSHSSTTSEIKLINADKPTGSPVVFLPRTKDHLYEVFHHEKGFYIISNEQAKNRKIVFSPTIPTSISACSVVIEHNPSMLIEGLLTLKNHLVIEIRHEGLLKINTVNLKTNKKEQIHFDEETYYLRLGNNDNYSAEKIFFVYNSLTTPSTVFNYDLNSHSREVYFRKELKDKSFDPANYSSMRIWATANDGSKIPISIVYKKGTVLAEAPCLLYGYGSYGYTLPDVFSATRLSLLDRGFVYATAHIRGSKYMGEEWYEDGKFLKKKNTFTDFINAAEYLGMQGYCAKDKIYAQGGSAGGLLMGAIANMAPYLWKGVVAQVPFVDVVTTMLDESIPLTVGEYEEWGNPTIPEYYYYMLNYSPYDNVKPMDYPAILVTTGYHDSQVQYWEPMKWVAKMRELRTNNNPLIFDCNMDAGHGGGSGRSNERKEVAQVYSFILNLEGITK